MTLDPLQIAALAITGGAALTDWWSVRTDRPRLESLAKPAVMILLLIFVGLAEIDGGLRLALFVALGFGLLGDVLLLPAIDRFVAGLASFLIGHLGYVAAALTFGTGNRWWLIAGGTLAGLAVGVAGRPIVAAVTGSRLRNPVALYVVVIAGAVTALIGTGRWPVAIGATLFATSDGLLGWTRFVDQRNDLRWLVHATYHIGQALIVVGLTTAA